MSQQRNAPGFLSMLALLTALCWSPAFAQTNDDLYYNPDREPVRKKTTTTTTTTTTEFYGDEQYDREPGNTTRPANTDEGYADDYEDDYAYEYSSRIRRFHRPTRVIDFYDPFYVDLHFYDPFFLPGASIYTFGFDDYWSYRRFRRFQRFNNGWGWNNPWNNGWGGGFNNGWGGGWNRGWGGGWNAWNNNCVFNNYFYDPYWTWNGFNPYYASGNVWVNNGVIINNGNNGGGNNGGGNNGGGGYAPRTYTGVRRGGTVVNPGYARIQDSNGGRGRLATAQAAGNMEQVIELGNNNGRADMRPDGTAPVRTAPGRPAANGRAVTEMPRANEEGVRSRDDSQPTSVRPGSDPVRTTRQPRATDARPDSDNATTPAPERPAREPRTYERPQQREYAPQQRETAPERPAREPRTYERPQQREYTPRQRESAPERSQERSNPQPQRSYERPQQREYNPPARSGGGDDGGSRGGGSGGGSSRGGSSGGGSSRSGSSNGRQ